MIDDITFELYTLPGVFEIIVHCLQFTLSGASSGLINAHHEKGQVSELRN